MTRRLLRHPPEAPVDLPKTLASLRSHPDKRLFIVLDDSDVHGPPEEAAWRVVVVSSGLQEVVRACGVPYYPETNPKSYRGAYAVPRWVRVLLDFAQTKHAQLAPLDWSALFEEAPTREGFLPALITLVELNASARALANFLLEHFPVR